MGHEIYLSIPKVELGNNDATITIKKGGRQMGYFQFSKGGIDYYPHKRKKQPITISWSRLDEIFKKYEKGEI